MKRAHIFHQGMSVWGVVEGEDIALPSGQRVAAGDAQYLPVTQPGAIYATHKYPASFGIKPHL